MSTSCINFRDKHIWENDLIIFLCLKLLMNSKQKKPNWLIKYYKNVFEYILKIMPFGTTELYLDTYFFKYYKRKLFVNYIKNVINEFDLDDGGVIDGLQINSMLNLSISDSLKENDNIEKTIVLNFLNNLIILLDIK